MENIKELAQDLITCKRAIKNYAWEKYYAKYRPGYTTPYHDKRRQDRLDALRIEYRSICEKIHARLPYR